jgi:hypothetical protein
MFHDKNPLPKTPTLITDIYKDFFFKTLKKFQVKKVLGLLMYKFLFS